MLWTAFTLAGMKISLLLKKHLTVLEETIGFLNSLIAEIQFSKKGIPEILLILSSAPSMQNLTFLKSFSDSREFTDLREAWLNSISSFSGYKSDEKEKMLQLGTFLGTTDTDNQISTIKLYLAYFSEYRDRARSYYEKNGKLSSLLGMFIGASVFVLFL